MFVAQNALNYCASVCAGDPNVVSVASRNTKKRSRFSLCLTTECFYRQVQDAQVAMKLYTLHRNQWERQLKELKFKHLKNDKSQKKLVSRQIR